MIASAYTETGHRPAPPQIWVTRPETEEQQPAYQVWQTTCNMALADLLCVGSGLIQTAREMSLVTAKMAAAQVVPGTEHWLQC